MLPIKIGITGGIGSGKSVVGRLLEMRGIPVYNSDREAKRLTSTHADIRSGLVALLGEEVFAENRLNKSLLAAYLFENEAHTRQINALIHPAVREDFRRWAELQGEAHRIVAIETAILFEAGFADEVDMRVMVYAPERLRVARTMARDGADEDTVIRRIRSQMSDEEKKTLCDFVIVNDEREAVIPQVERLMDIVGTT
ncbi:MAG: dephospho-CoA kinase [Prevotellaceae bacterium]|jgi:dephospho-CoA kinase|nr:dephospho-CoA kinase [Prevotellaceae bacterium]